METQGRISSAWIIFPAATVEVFSKSIEFTVGWLKWYCIFTFKRRRNGRK